MASLYQRKGSTKWYIKIHQPGTGRGKADRIPTGTADRDEAQRQLDAMLGDRAQGLPINTKAHTVQFWQLAELVLDDYKVSEFKTFNIAKRRFEMHISPFFGLMRAVAILPRDITTYRMKRKNAGAKLATVSRELELIKRAFTLGQQNYKIQGPPIEMPVLNNAKKGFFEQDDFEKVMAAINPQYRDVLLFLYVTGWRIGEVRDLRRRHIDFRNRQIRLDPGTTKNGDPRVFPMIAGLDGMLRRIVPQHGFPNDYVFTYKVAEKTPRGEPQRWSEPRPIGDFGKAFATACFQAGLPCRTEPWSYTEPKSGKIFSGIRVLKGSHTPHDFRRTAVRNLTNMGTPEKVAMEMCGHRTREVFDRYRIVAQTDLDIAAERMNKAYNGLMSALAVGPVVGTVSGPTISKFQKTNG